MTVMMLGRVQGGLGEGGERAGGWGEECDEEEEEGKWEGGKKGAKESGRAGDGWECTCVGTNVISCAPRKYVYISDEKVAATVQFGHLGRC